MARAEVDVGRSSLAPHAALLMPPRCPTGSVVTPHGLTGSAKVIFKADLAIYSYIVTVSVWTLLECGYNIKQ